MVNELAWGGYQNGRIPLDALKVVSFAGGHRGHPIAVDALVRLNDAFRARFGANIVITDSYRDYDAQVRVRAEKGNLAATPGTSNHGWGRALDLSSNINKHTSAEHAWMQANAPGYGWILPSWAQQGGSKPEPWHWEFPNLNGGTTPVPLPEVKEEEKNMMVLATNGTDPQVWIGDGITRRRVATQSTLSTIHWLGAPERKILGPFYANGAIQTIADLWSLGYPIDDAIEGNR